MSTELASVEIQTGIISWLERAKNFEIIDSESLKIAGSLVLDVKRFRTKTVIPDLGPQKAATGRAHKVACTLYNKYVNPLLAVEKQFTTKIYAYEQKMERIRREAAEKAEREAEERNRKEKKQLEAVALAAADRGDEEAFAQAEAKKEMISPEDYIPIPAPPERMPTGISTRKNWQFEVTNFKALVEAWRKGDVSSGFITADLKAIGKFVKAVGDTQKIPGIRVYDVGTVGLRS